MGIEVVKIYVICDDILQALGVVDGPQAKTTNAEVMGFAMIAGRLSDTATECNHSFWHFTDLDSLRP